VEIGGVTAALEDQSQWMKDRLPLFITGVVLLSFLLLLVAWLVFLARRGRWPSALGVVVNFRSCGAGCCAPRRRSVTTAPAAGASAVSATVRRNVRRLR